MSDNDYNKHDKYIEIKLDGITTKTIKNANLEQIIPSDSKSSLTPIVAAIVNNKFKELSYVPEDGDDIELLDILSSEGNRVYQRGLIHTLVRAATEVLPGCQAHVNSAIGEGLYIEIVDKNPLTPFIVDKIGRKMRGYVNDDDVFYRKLLTKEEAVSLYERAGQFDKVRLLVHRDDDVFKTYTAGNYSDYFYGYMPPSTGYLQNFRLIYEMPGLIMLFPNSSNPEFKTDFMAPRKLMHILRESDTWGKIVKCEVTADLNDLAKDKDALIEFILINEARHESEISKAAEQVVSENARLVLVAGPSSSGKTTFTQKLLMHMRMSGKNTHMLSLDNYYIDREKIPLEEDGSVDLENIDTLDLPLLNQHLEQLLDGKTVEIPKFDFETAKRVEAPSSTIQLGSNDVLLVEGIHGLNNMLSESVSNKDKCKIYISALTQLNLDYHNRIPTTDVRLLRRMVRDSVTRNASAEDTLSMWESVRRGEERWIFAFQESADIMFNSTLLYEMLFLKKHAWPLLSAIAEDSKYYVETVRLIKFLKYFVDVPDEYEDIVPNNSLLREFIGGGLYSR